METHFEHTREQAAEHTHKQAARSVEWKFYSFGERAQPVGKFVSVLFLILCLLIPLEYVKNLISARESYQNQVTEEIADTHAPAQTITGPILAIRYRIKTSERSYQDSESSRILTRAASISEHLEYIPARELAIRGSANAQPRDRGIYQARVFRLNAEVEGEFEAPADLIKIPDGTEIVDANASILFGLSDLRGLKAYPEVRVNKETLRFKKPTDRRFEEVMNGNQLEIDLGAWTPGTITFSFPLELSGTGSLSISPTAENNTVDLKSDWKHPSFKGRFLPDSKPMVNAKGFTAQWKISQLTFNLEDSLKNDKEVLKIEFIEPVNIYLQAERAVKYGSLFIVLTFAAFFIGEVLRRRPMHIMQYALVGLSLAIFFLLLFALSEKLPFAVAYLAGAVACIGLITVYLAGVFNSWRTATAFGGGLAVLYGMLFGILQLEDMALLMGSLLLFAALAAAMFSTRRFDWYQLKQSEAITETSGE